MINPELISEDVIEAAIADAVLYSYAQDLNPVKEELNESGNLEEFTRSKTEGQCIRNSARAAFFLWSRYPDYFESMFVLSLDLRGTDGIEFIRDPNWDTHGGLVAKDINGTYWFLSPGNYKPNTDDLTAVTRADSLQGLLDEVQEREGGIWPTAEEVEHNIDSDIPRLEVFNETNFYYHDDLVRLTDVEREELGLTDSDYVAVTNLMFSVGEDFKARNMHQKLAFPNKRKSYRELTPIQ